MRVNSFTIFDQVQLANIAASGPIGTAAATVDIATNFAINQTTAGLALTLPNPTQALNGAFVIVSNSGSASFTLNGTIVFPGQFSSFEWDNAAWRIPAGATPPDFWRDTTAAQARPDGTNDTTEGIAHDGTVHFGSEASNPLISFHHESILSYIGNNNFQYQVITTTIPIDSTIMPTIFIKGYNYGTSDEIDLQLSLYTYNAPSGSIINTAWVSKGTYQPTQIRAGYLGGFLVLELTWPAAEYYQRWEVSAYCDGPSAGTNNMFQGWTVSNTGAFSGGVTNVVTIPRKRLSYFVDAPATRTVSANATFDLINDQVLFVNANAGNVQVTLPAPVLPLANQNTRITIKRVDNNPLFTARVGFSAPIDGAPGNTILLGTSTAYGAVTGESVVLVWDNTANTWRIV
jgi:hypothetical protein